jgi:predicted porin
MSGFTGRLMLSAPEGALAKNYGASLTYQHDRLYVAAAYDDAQTAGATVGLPAVPDTRSKTFAIGATYRLDVAKLFGYIQNNRVSDLPSVNGYLLGATVPFGAGEFRVSTLHTNRDGAEASLLAVGYAYHLSKRTQVYTSAARLSNDGKAHFGMWPGSQELNATGVPTAGQDVSGFQVGMRHTF